MKPMPDEMLEKMRLLAFEIEYYGGSGVGSGNGVFGIRRKGVNIRINASQGEGWDHVSVSTPERCPTWDEMCFVKDLFFGEDEVVMQLHPAKSDYVNNHPFCLHLWRPWDVAIPLPPSIFVGKQSLGTLDLNSAEDEARALAAL